MSPDWTLHGTTTHQDHVIAHVIGATILGYYRTDQTIHILLDIGFIWLIYVDGEMGLLPQSLAISEMDVEAVTRTRISEDVRVLEAEGRDAAGLTEFAAAPVECLITQVSLYARDDERRLIIEGEESSLVLETSLVTGEVRVLR